MTTLLDCKEGQTGAGEPDDTHPCVDCGDPYFQRIGGYWKVDDGLWAEVVGDNTITLCPACFAARANTQGIYLRWTAHRDTTTEEVTMKNSYWKRPALVRQHDGGNLIIGPFQLNWYGHGVRLHVTWPRQKTLVIR